MSFCAKITLRLSFLLLIVSTTIFKMHAQNVQSGAVDSISLINTNTQNFKSVDSIIELGKTFLGKPYRFQGPNGRAMDCSGYLSYIFSAYGFTLPFSSSSIASSTKEVNFDQVRKGDLLFFKGRNKSSSSIGHVTLVISIDNGKIQMMHSCSRGVIIDQYEEMTYYTERFIKAGRPLFFDH